MTPDRKKGRSSSIWAMFYLSPSYTFDTFVPGPSNQNAYDAAMRVVENPGAAYNPLFISATAGLGKTHLLNAIGNAIVDKFPDKIVCYFSTEQFAWDFIKALRHQKMAEFRNQYRNVDVMLIDSIKYFANLTATQEEFCYTISALYLKQCQIVITSDCFLQELSNINERLRLLFKIGLTAAIEPPDVKTRIAIIYKKAATEKIVIPEGVAHLIAATMSNMRELTGLPIDVAMARGVLRSLE